MRSWIAPLYGYVVCVIAVVTFLVNVTGFVDATFDRANPLAGRESYGPYGGSLTSFEAFRATYEDGRPMRVAPASTDPNPQRDTLTTEQLRARYEALREDRMIQGSYQATRRLVRNGLLIALSIILFATHWTWARRQRDTTAADPT
jgi:hypothetical protein